MNYNWYPFFQWNRAHAFESVQPIDQSNDRTSDWKKFFTCWRLKSITPNEYEKKIQFNNANFSAIYAAFKIPISDILRTPFWNRKCFFLLFFSQNRTIKIALCLFFFFQSLATPSAAEHLHAASLIIYSKLQQFSDLQTNGNQKNKLKQIMFEMTKSFP